jgi:hypothetical protein
VNQTEEEYSNRRKYPKIKAMEKVFSRDRLAEALREKARKMIMTLAEAELPGVLAAGSHERREGRRGDRNDKRPNRLARGWERL